MNLNYDIIIDYSLDISIYFRLTPNLLWQKKITELISKLRSKLEYKKKIRC